LLSGQHREQDFDGRITISLIGSIFLSTTQQIGPSQFVCVVAPSMDAVSELPSLDAEAAAAKAAADEAAKVAAKAAKTAATRVKLVEEVQSTEKSYVESLEVCDMSNLGV
jgi:hypothetical protein